MTGIDSTTASVVVDTQLIKKLELCKIVQGSAQSAVLACKCKQVRFKHKVKLRLQRSLKRATANVVPNGTMP